MKKIGILGGTFNPIHHRHLILGQAAKEEYGLDEILVMPTKNPAYKKSKNQKNTKKRRLKNMSNEFSHLHVHSDYSLLDGLGKIGDYVKYGKSLGMKAMAFTDHGTMAGLVTAYDTC